jgi:hypothetical protein
VREKLAHRQVWLMQPVLVRTLYRVKLTFTAIYPRTKISIYASFKGINDLGAPPAFLSGECCGLFLSFANLMGKTPHLCVTTRKDPEA